MIHYSYSRNYLFVKAYNIFKSFDSYAFDSQTWHVIRGLYVTSFLIIQVKPLQVIEAHNLQGSSLMKLVFQLCLGDDPSTPISFTIGHLLTL
jgi:hypothetical protein